MNAIKRIAFLLALCLLLTGSVFAARFPDVADQAPYAEAVEAMAEQGILEGNDQGLYQPDKAVTRAEAAAIICRMLGLEQEIVSQSTGFQDVPKSHWASGYVAEAADRGIINGYGDGRFGPSAYLTYQQMIKMLVCAWGYGDAAESRGGWPNGYLSVADDLGITEGASVSATRGNVAQLVYNTMMLEPYVEAKSYLLDDMDVARSSETRESGDLSGMDGTAYTTSLAFYPSQFGTGGYVEYALDRNYETLTGTIYIPRQARSVDDSYENWNKATIRIYDNDELIYTKTGGFSREMEPISISLDVRGVHFLKVQMDYCFDSRGAGYTPLVCLGDLTLHTAGSGIALD